MERNFSGLWPPLGNDSESIQEDDYDYIFRKQITKEEENRENLNISEADAIEHFPSISSDDVEFFDFRIIELGTIRTCTHRTWTWVLQRKRYSGKTYYFIAKSIEWLFFANWNSIQEGDSLLFFKLKNKRHFIIERRPPYAVRVEKLVDLTSAENDNNNNNQSEAKKRHGSDYGSSSGTGSSKNNRSVLNDRRTPYNVRVKKLVDPTSAPQSGIRQEIDGYKFLFEKEILGSGKRTCTIPKEAVRNHFEVLTNSGGSESVNLLFHDLNKKWINWRWELIRRDRSWKIQKNWPAYIRTHLLEVGDSILFYKLIDTTRSQSAGGNESLQRPPYAIRFEKSNERGGTTIC